MASGKGKKSAGPRKGGRGRKRKKGKVTAEQADRHRLYQLAVQSPDADIEFFTDTFERERGRRPRSLREDFCGTAYLATEWAKSDPERTALGVDLDGPTLAWGKAHNLEPAGDEVAARVQLIEGDVLEVETRAVDILCAMNFSYCVFKSREVLLRYFRRIYQTLADDGVFFTELYGGTEAIEELEDTRECTGFDYLWEQESYNPINHETVCHISFVFPDGSKMRRAFTYDWRLWTIAEVREVMAEAGFASSRVYWEEVDDDGEGTGEYHVTECEENQESWLCYIVAFK